MPLGKKGACLQLRNVSVRFAGQRHALFDIAELDVPGGGSVGIRGPSGAGKTTLLHCLAGIAPPSGGSVCWDGLDIVRMPDDERDRWRRSHLGLVFQDFHLIDGLSALDNILLPAYFAAWRPDKNLRCRARGLLDAVGLDPAAAGRVAAQLSRGERQRVAFARALLLGPGVVMADEPTASLDPDRRARLGDLLVDLARSHGTTLVVISHEQELLARMDRCLTLHGGRLSPSSHQLSRAGAATR